MGYTTPAYSRLMTNSTFDGFVETKKFSNFSNYRTPVQSCYTSAFEYFTKNDQLGAYIQGKYIDMKNFPDLRNDYFYMENTAPKSLNSAGNYSSEWWSMDSHNGSVFKSDWRVYYSMYGIHYELTLNKEKYIRELIISISIGWLLIILSLIYFRFSNPRLFRNLLLFGKRWKNTSNDSQVLIFDYSFFSSCKFTEIVNDNVAKGVLKLTDKGNTVNLSYSNKELFYKIEKIDKDNLLLISLKDGNIVPFVRIGAKIKEPTQKQYIESTENEAKE
jgi:hypothetical protein